MGFSEAILALKFRRDGPSDQLSEYCKTALPFLAMFYAGLPIYYDGPKDRAVYYKQGIAVLFYAAWHMRLFGSLT